MIDTTAVTREAAVADEWVRTVCATNLRGAPLIVGLDCEWKPNYYLSWMASEVAILRLCAATRCLDLQLFYVDRIPASIRSFLADQDVLFVGIGVGEDVAKLGADYGLTCVAHVGLEGRCSDYLGHTGGRRLVGLQGYAEEVLGLVMEKPRVVTMSNWQKHDLEETKIRYACFSASLDCECSWKTTTSDVGRPSSSSAPRQHPLPLAPALHCAADRMGCRRPLEGFAVVIAFMVLLFLLAGLAAVSCHVSPTVAVKYQAVHFRKLLNNDTSRADGSNSRGTAAMAYVASADLCSEEVVEVSQGSAGSLPNGVPSYSVTITNTCLDCTVCNVHVSCGEFASTGLVDPSDFRRLSYDDCLVKNGGPIGPGEIITFEYSNSFIYKMEVAIVSCADI